MRASILLWILLAQTIGGATPALTKLALAGIGPWSLVVARQLLGALFLLGLAALWRSESGRGGRLGLRQSIRVLDGLDWLLLLLLSWAGFALPQILNALGLQRSTATNGALLSPLEPIGILIGGALLLREPLTLPRALAVALGLGGASLIVAQGGLDPSAGNLRGDLLMALGHLAWAVYTLAAKRLVARHDPLQIAILASVLSVFPLLPLAATESSDTARLLPALGWIVLLAFLSTGILSFAWNRALQEVSAGTMAAFIFVQPLVGVLLGALVLGEPFGLQALAGAALIVAGVSVATLRGEGGGA